MGEGSSKPVSSVHSDLFCGCGYNLYAQRVEIDERLGLPLCRCPECGRWHALNTTLGVQSPAAGRFWLLATLFYAVVLLSVIGLATFGLCGMQYGMVEMIHEAERAQEYRRSMPADELEQLLIRWMPELMGLLCALCGLIYMTIATTFFWHWKRDFYWYVLLVPVLGAAAVYLIGVEDHDRAFLHPMGQVRTGMAAVATGVGMAAGIFLGRKIVRGLLRLLLPVRMRQLMAFLWTVDGLPAPALAARPDSTNPPAQPPIAP